jgi:hypothetical protein
MLRRKALIAAVGATLAVAGLAVAPAAEANGHVGFSVSIAGPGYAVGFGQPYYAPYYRPAYVAPPVVYTAPAYSYYPAPVYAAPVVVAAPYRYYHRPYYGRAYYHYHR